MPFLITLKKQTTVFVLIVTRLRALAENLSWGKGQALPNKLQNLTKQSMFKRFVVGHLSDKENASNSKSM